MSADEWIEDGLEAVDFAAYDGCVTLAKNGGLLYVEVTHDGDGEQLSIPVESKEILRMAHWIIKEFAHV